MHTHTHTHTHTQHTYIYKYICIYTYTYRLIYVVRAQTANSRTVQRAHGRRAHRRRT